MYTKYTYNPSATETNLLSDIIAILTGETTPSNLSADCDQANTTINTTTTTAGWTIHDASATPNSQVLKAPYTDTTDFKYVEIEINTSKYLNLYAYETFDNVNHIGTNKTTHSSTSSDYSQSLGTSGGTVHILASPRFIALVRENNDWGTNNDKGISIVAEFSRTQPWNTITSGYPSLAYIAAGYAISGDERAIMFPRAKNNENTDLTGTAATAFMATEGAIGNSLISGIPSGPNSKIYDNEGNKYAPFLPIMLMDKDKYSYRVGEISTICDIWLPPRSLLANKELISKNSQEYIALQTYSTTHMLLFPHG
jgi:hypothetical protein